MAESQKAYASSWCRSGLSWYPPYEFAGNYYWKDKVYLRQKVGLRTRARSALTILAAGDDVSGSSAAYASPWYVIAPARWSMIPDQSDRRSNRYTGQAGQTFGISSGATGVLGRAEDRSTFRVAIFYAIIRSIDRFSDVTGRLIALVDDLPRGC